jgi:ubiquitin-protein ligase
LNDELRKKIENIIDFYRDDEEVVDIMPLSDPPSLLRITIQITHGPTYDLGEHENMYPFREYIKPQEILIHLPLDYPDKAPDITWGTAIPHPNIVPNKKNNVCNNYVKKQWSDYKSFSFVIRTLTETLRNPNPWEPYVNDYNKEAIRICQEMGFPKALVEEPEENFMDKVKGTFGARGQEGGT